MTRPIFISYRRADTLATSGRLADRLAEEFGPERVFIDVDDIPPGNDFVKELDRQIAACSVLLVIIGPGWLDARDEHGSRRLDNPRDFARIEVRAALMRKRISVIPVLVDGAAMPEADDLPGDLKPLARRQAVTLRNSHFASDAGRLVRHIRQTLKVGRSIPPMVLAVGASCAVALAASGVAIWALVGTDGSPPVVEETRAVDQRPPVPSVVSLPDTKPHTPEAQGFAEKRELSKPPPPFAYVDSAAAPSQVWGAIVYARAANAWGMAWGHRTRGEAVARARDLCSAGEQRCAVEVAFSGTECAAIASSPKAWSIKAHEGVERARDAALADCQRQGGRCTLLAEICARAER